MYFHSTAMTVALILSLSSFAASAQGAPQLAQAAQTPGTAPETPAAPKLLGVAAWKELVGNSITGKKEGKTLVEYYAPDGTAKSMLDNEISTGKWALVGETICFQYADEKEMECYRLEVAGNTATFTDQKGTGTRYEILKGNPKGL
ncbi:MAG TPA: hypothetical protein VJY33_17435 [Isosphaeraceae bacterium]|nr:hypothetical protein [Isosphaeraceae bacterium]